MELIARKKNLVTERKNEVFVVKTARFFNWLTVMKKDRLTG